MNSQSPAIVQPKTIQETHNLSDKETAFVYGLVTQGLSKTDAMIQAGYSPKTARVQAYHILEKPNVVQAMLDLTAIELISAAPEAQKTLRDLLKGKSEYVRLQAAQDLLDRAGFKPKETVNHQVSGEIQVSIDLG